MKNTTKEQLSAFIDGETSEFEELSLSRSLSQGEDFIDSWTSYLKIRGATSVRDPLNPEDHQPSGTCNFSRIDNAFLNLTLSSNSVSSSINSGNVKIQVYAINYNILRVMSGLGGLAYSN